MARALARARVLRRVGADAEPCSGLTLSRAPAPLALPLRARAQVHSPEFQIHLTLREGELLMMNNWRTMHGRAGLKGKARTILGGTVTRDAFVSATRELRRKQLGFLDKNDGLECGMRLSDMGLLGELRASDEAKMAA